jgi:hypothetical protein
MTGGGPGGISPGVGIHRDTDRFDSFACVELRYISVI